ncbi:ABC transporter permease subunit [Aquipuribacter nitratireducens]|uniref:ABC transporter permease subunit n=1 Tax=Aquipuribacter nitratireducens TaxID=650104 RepID=A0ABW0GI03_9MICO
MTTTPAGPTTQPAPPAPRTPTSPWPARPRPRGLPLLATGLRQRARGLLLWSLGLAAVVLMYLPLYPSIATTLQEQVSAMPEGVVAAFGMGETDPAGYAQTTVYGLLGAVLVIVFAVTGSSRLVAAEEESGLLELYLSHGVSRQRVLAERALLLLLELVVLTAVVVTLTLVLGPGADLGFDAPQVLAAGAGLLGIGVLVGGVGLGVGAMTGSRGLATGAAALAGVGGYLANVVADIADLPWLERLSAFHWAYGHEPLRAGFDGDGAVLLLYGVAALAYAVGAVVLARRDVGV